jgi:hypothetical protein
VFKKAFQVVMTFGMLLAGYAGYVRVFALVAERLGSAGQPTAVFLGGPAESKTAAEARELAIRAFGKGHWAADDKLPIRIYDHDRGFWVYARGYKRHADGKKVEFFPFALIWKSGDGKSLKTATSDIAVLDFDKQLRMIPQPGQSGAPRVVHARIEGDVRLRDDKGTADEADDLKIGPMTFLEYDEPTLKISGDDVETVVIEDQLYRITGQGLTIKLRPREQAAAPVAANAPTGFNGAETAYLNKNVHIVIADVGASGYLPGSSTAARRAGEKVPLDLRSDGPMQIDLAKPRLQPRIGPPAPGGPTVAQFFRNVEVLRGKPGVDRDQLNCDHLRLTLYPQDRDERDRGREERAKARAQRKPGDDPLTEPVADLALRRAEATGHNVRLYSAAQGVKARCNELIYKKQLPEAADETYFRGDATSRLVIEKTDIAREGPDRGKATSYTVIRTVDATIFEDRRGNDYATIVARGPGEMETRPGPGKPVKHTARWGDQLFLQPVLDPSAKPAAVASAPASAAPGSPSPPLPPPARKLTLTGRPSFADVPGQASLAARGVICVWLRPRAQPAGATKGSGTAAATGAYEIQELVAREDVRLRSPGKTLAARDFLDAKFEHMAGLLNPASLAPKPAAPAPATTPAPAPATPAESPAPKTPAPAPAPAKPAEPEARAVADRVWARVLVRPDGVPGAGGAGSTVPGGGPGAGQIELAQLRGKVSVQQDPAEGKTRGTEVSGEAVDLYNRGEGKTKFIVFNHDPTADPPRPADAPEAKNAAAKIPPAVVKSDEMSIVGNVIGLDQSTDEAWVDGQGAITQMTTRGLLSDRAPASAPDAPANANANANANAQAQTRTPTPMTIWFAQGMKFNGRPTDAQGRPAPARAEFLKDVHAETEDASIDGRERMIVDFDRPIRLARPRTQGQTQGQPVEPKPEIARIECVDDVVVINVKLHPESKAVLEKQRIEGDRLVYDRQSGRFFVPGEGIVFLWQRDGRVPGAGGPGGLGLPGAGAGAAAPIRRRTITPTAGPDPDAPRAIQRVPVVGRNSNPTGEELLLDRVPHGRGPSRSQVPVIVPDFVTALPPLMLTQIHFTHRMTGRIGSGRETDRTARREADFHGDVEALRAQVDGPSTPLDFDRRPPRSQLISAGVLRVVSEPPADTDDPNARPRNFLRAWDNAMVSADDKTIQADEITFDSLENKFWAYGHDGHEVVLAQQAEFGQAASVTHGTALMYNHKTGERKLVSPGSIAFVDSKTGLRPAPAPPPPDPKVKRPKRRQFRNLRGNIERKDFTGR